MDALAELGSILVGALRSTAAMVFDPGERIYWLFLLSAGLIAIVVSRISPRSTPARGSWWLDLKLLVTNAVLGALAVAVWTVSAFGLAVFLVARLDAAFGPARIEAFSPMLVCLVYTAALFVASDASRFLVHWLMHVIGPLWELHKVHHSAERLTPLTLYRAHPIERAIYAARGVIVTGLITAVFFHLFGRDAVELELLGVNALGFLFNLVGANLRHSHVWWSWGRLERVLLSPAQHQVHHGVDGTHTLNLGTWLACWDRWAGTFREAGPRPPIAFGLPARERNHDPDRLASVLWHPLRAAVSRALAHIF
jgi:sterol desaturase/sphingolipid hydroxylase (fatty acid hydroxylase superfamily)